jgi:GTP-binding protein
MEVVDMVYELFMELDANNAQLDFPILYGVAKHGIAKTDMEDDSDDITPLFDTIISHAEAYPDYNDEPLQMQVSTLAYDDYIGRLGIGRIYKGTVRTGQTVSVCKEDGSIVQRKINQVFVYKGLKRTAVEEAECGDVVVLSGISDISIGETVCDVNNPAPLEMIHIEEPTLSMNFMVNKSPFAGKSGKYVTSRHLKERLEKELEVNVGLPSPTCLS